MDDEQRDAMNDAPEVDPGNPPGTDSSIPMAPDPTDPARQRAREPADEDDAIDSPSQRPRGEGPDPPAR
jgi:hypothetical protein